MTIHLTDAAAAAIRAADPDPAASALRIVIDDQFRYDLRLDAPVAGDLVIETGGITIVIDASSAARADGLTLDFDATAAGGGFTIDNPNAPREIVQLSARELRALIDSDASFELLDVRTPAERAIARIDGARLLDQAVHDELMAGERGRTLVFYCHHGMRSQSAADHFRRAGFTRLYNLQGGIDAWSVDVDPDVPRY